MWIRSANKQILIKTNLFTMFESSYGTTTINAWDGDGEWCVGTYRSLDRAKQVLSDIQSFINCDGEINDYKLKVFQMPEK